jgi:hypothetical protein
MPDIEDIIENLAPFAFVLIWILSAVFGRTKEQPPAKTTKPIFAPPKRDTVVASPASAAKPAPFGASTHWDELESFDRPYSDPDFAPQPTNRNSTKEDPSEILRRLIRERARQARVEDPSESTTKKVVSGLSQPSPSASSAKPMDLSHLVADKSAETHLEHSLTNRSPEASATQRPKSAALAALTAEFRDRDAVRRAFVMSIVLGEPRTKTKL